MMDLRIELTSMTLRTLNKDQAGKGGEPMQGHRLGSQGNNNRFDWGQNAAFSFAELMESYVTDLPSLRYLSIIPATAVA